MKYLFFLMLFPVPLQTKQPFVQLKEYGAYGFLYEYQQYGKKFLSNAFFGLPYAQAPLGKLRLEKPQSLPVDPLKVINNTELPPGCLAQEDFGALFPNGDLYFPTSEDCLFLSVIAPCSPPNTGVKYPVIAWIHGGAFSYGMNRIDGWKQLSRHFNSRGIVVVHVQYRLALWGFFSLGTNVGEAGNFGLWDLTAALRFVNQHISSFGGDPNRVTVFGNSAGSVLTHSLSLSPHSYNYFQQTIQSSGSLYNPWSRSLKTIKSSQNLSQALKCYFPEAVQATKNCLKNMTVSQIWDVLKGWGRVRNSMDLLYWGPIMDEEFFVGQNIGQLTKNTPIRKTLYGCNKGDGMTFTFDAGSVLSSTTFLARTVDQQVNYNKTEFYDHVYNYLGRKDTAGPFYVKIRQLFLDYYTRGSNVSNLPDKFWYTRFTDAHTDGGFAGGQIMEISKKMNFNWKQYVYLFDYVHPSHRPLFGIDPSYCPHAYEYQYLMDSQPYFPFQKSETNFKELVFTEKIVNAFALFAKFGDPSSKEVLWPAVDDPVQIKYLRVGEQVVAENSYFTEIAKLWKKVYDLGYARSIWRA